MNIELIIFLLLLKKISRKGMKRGKFSFKRLGPHIITILSSTGSATLKSTQKDISMKKSTLSRI